MHHHGDANEGAGKPISLGSERIVAGGGISALAPLCDPTFG